MAVKNTAQTSRVTKTSKNKQKEKYFGSVKFFKHLITLIILLVFLALLGLVLYLLFGGGEEEQLVIPDGGDGRGILLTPENIEAWRNRPDATDTHFTTEMSVEWEFERWDVPPRKSYIANSVLNHRLMYFEMFLADENSEDGLGEMIYDSPYIPVGAKLDGKLITLRTELAKGNYPTVVVYRIVDEEFDIVADVSVEVIIKILNDAD